MKSQRQQQKLQLLLHPLHHMCHSQLPYGQLLDQLQQQFQPRLQKHQEKLLGDTDIEDDQEKLNRMLMLGLYTKILRSLNSVSLFFIFQFTLAKAI